MKLKIKVKSKKVLAIILVAITVFCNGFKPTNTYAQESNSNTRIEEMTNQRKVIDVKRNNTGTSTNITVNGKTYKARKMQVKASAYTSAPNEGGAYAYNGERLREGHIAADLTVLPLNTKIYIPELNRICTVVDKGSAIKNNKIDIFMNSRQKAMQWGIKNITIYVLE